MLEVDIIAVLFQEVVLCLLLRGIQRGCMIYRDVCGDIEEEVIMFKLWFGSLNRQIMKMNNSSKYLHTKILSKFAPQKLNQRLLVNI